MPLPAWGVYPIWVCINKSKHEALSPPPAYPYQPSVDHVEFTTVHGWFMPSQKFSKTVKFDGVPVALEGHDSGLGIPHWASAHPANIMLPLTLLGASHKWPFTAGRRCIDGHAPATFFPGWSPYLYCVSRKKEAAPAAKPDADAGPPTAGAEFKEGVAGNVKSFKENIPGFGHLCIAPVGTTVVLELSLGDLLLGVWRTFVEIGLSTAFSAAFKCLNLDSVWGKADEALEPLQKELAEQLTDKEVSKAVASYYRRKLRDKFVQDAVKGVANDRQLTLPYKLATFDLDTGELKGYSWSHETGWAKHPSMHGKGLKERALITWANPRAEDGQTSTPEPTDDPLVSEDTDDHVCESAEDGYPGLHDSSNDSLDPFLANLPHAG
ncbi:MAG: hypothetical protein HC927_06015 [Deltaproteobacteria bacterium]|nr:hypothetical protein [Deltaproteobacteria bacterium]